MDLNQMMAQAKAMQKQLEQEQAAFQKKVYTVTSANELVKVIMTGDKRIKDLEIRQDILTPDDQEMIQDLIISTIDEAMDMIDQDFAQTMGKYTQGLDLPF